MNKQGDVVETEVLNTFKNGVTNSWLKVRGTRFAVGRGGNGVFIINCTPEHKFYLSEKNIYLKAKYLKNGDKVNCLRTDLGLNPIQKEILIGKFLGDGSIKLTTISGKLSWAHKKAHEDYIDWTSRGLGKLAINNKKEYLSGYGSQVIRQ